MTKVITWANNKGGSAKTTTTTTVAHGLTMMLEKATDNNKILVVDTDSQAHSTLLLCGHADFEDDASLIGVLNAQRINGNSAQQVRKVILESNWHPNLHVLPVAEGLSLDNVEAGLSGYDGNVFYLERILQEVKDDYSLIFIDTSPKFSLLTKMALLASDEVMIPVAPAYLDANGLVNMIKRVHEIRDAWGRQNPLVTGVVIVKLSSRVNGHKEIHQEIRTNSVLGKMYMGYVPINSEIEYAQAAQQSIFTYNPNANSAQAYADVIRHIAQHLFAKEV